MMDDKSIAKSKSFEPNSNSYNGNIYSSSFSNSSNTETKVTKCKFSPRPLDYNVDENFKKNIKLVPYPPERLICFKSCDDKNMIVYINNCSIIIEKENIKIKTIESQDYIININNFKFNNKDYIIYSICDGSIEIYNLEEDNTQNIKNVFVFEKGKNPSFCTILDENNLYIFECCDSNYIKKCIYYNNIDSTSFVKYYPEEENNEIYYYIVKSFYSQIKKKYFIIFSFSSKSNNENKISSIHFENKNIYNTYNYFNSNCDNFEIYEYYNDEYLFVCYKQDLICYNFHNAQNVLHVPEKNFKFKGISIYNRFIFLGGYNKKQTYIYIYDLKNKKYEEIFEELKTTNLKISNGILIIYNKQNETIKKFDINFN